MSTTLRIMKPEVAASKLSSAKGSASASAVANGKATAPLRVLLPRPRTIISRVRSTPTTSQAQIAPQRLVGDIAGAGRHVEQTADRGRLQSRPPSAASSDRGPAVISRFIRS